MNKLSSIRRIFTNLTEKTRFNLDHLIIFIFYNMFVRVLIVKLLAS